MMYKLLKNLCVLFCAVIFISSCRKQAFDDYYGRPDNLQPPIYQVLQDRGNFTSLLAVIDKSGYKSTLSAAGYWTFFAPNDAAFQKYFSDNSVSLANLDSVTARKIVTYCLVFNAFQTNHLADYQSPQGWVTNNAYKRRTAYYDGFYTGNAPDGASTVLLSSNRNASNNGTSFIFGDNNNKYIPYFYAPYMSTKSLSATDYNYFFPSSTYSGFNVVDASVVNKDIVAENGVIHEIDRVVLPLPNIEQQLASNSQYSQFRDLFEKFMVTYLQSADASSRYSIITGKNNKVYIKQYSSLLAYALGNENFRKVEDNDGQSDGYSLFAPTNAALTQYLNSVLLEFYGSVDKLPNNIVADFLNAHMFPSTVWPTKFSSASNTLGEPARFNVNNNVVDKKFCSNGVFYGTNQVQAANVFSTVYARAYLDPAYSIMTRILDLNLKTVVANPNLKFTVFMIPDATFRALGYDYNTNTSQFTLTVNGSTSTGAAPRDQLQRIVNLHVVQTPDNELNSVAGQGIVESYGGEYVRYSNNTVFAGGNVEKNQVVSVNGSRNYSNGKVYFLGNGALDFPVGTLASQIGKSATTTTSPYYDFYQYLINSTVYNPTNLEIIGLQLGANYTVFIPTKAAIQQAVKDGILPGTVSTGIPNYNPSSIDDKAKVARFILTHILNGIAIATDGKKSPNGSSFPTLLKNAIGDDVNLSITNQPGSITVRDYLGRSANTVAANSNYLGTRALFHQIDNYLRYNF
jgi:uncharacterized surface protein with fasciclin (FAS1) repeats